MSSIDLKNIKKVHFIGIGGIGISALAELMHHDGKSVVGTNDNASPQTLDRIRALGVQIHIGADIKNISLDTDLIIYSLAWDDMEFEFMKQVRLLGIPVLTYFEALGVVSKEKYTVAVAGTHGKTTTTAMLAKIFSDAGRKPTVIVGSLLKDSKSNFIAGAGKYFIVESCEYRRSFLNLNPQVLIITNIDNDHLDYYKDLADIQSAFAELAAKIPEGGALVCDQTDPALAPVVAAARCRVIDYRKVLNSDKEKITLRQPGEHNQKDAQAALAVAELEGVDRATALASLADFGGTWRRFEYKGEMKNGAILYDDYAHHPTEIAATIAGAREMLITLNRSTERSGKGKIIVAFQPHLYSRTKLLLADFVHSLSLADVVIVPDIYAAREENDGTVSSNDLVELLKRENKEAYYVPTLAGVAKVVEEKSAEGDIVITMGAGDVFKVGEKLLEQ